MIYLLPILTSFLYRLRGMQKWDWLGKLGLIIVMLLSNYQHNIYLTVALTIISTLAMCTIFGSINPFSEKDCGGLKGYLLKLGYKHSILATNLTGLAISGYLQCAFLALSSPWLVLTGLMMPVCYYVGTAYFGDTGKSEIMWGFFLGCGIIGGLIL